MRYYPVDLSPYIANEGKYATFEEFNREAAETLSVLHGIDGDNLDESITRAKVASLAFGALVYDQVAAVTSVALTEGTPANTQIPVPDAAGDPWTVDVETGDGFIRGAFRCELLEHTNVGHALWGIVKIDGVTVARAPCPRGYYDAIAINLPGYSLSCRFAAPVASGVHRVEFFLVTNRESPAGTVAAEVGARAYFMRECLR